MMSTSQCHEKTYDNYSIQTENSPLLPPHHHQHGRSMAIRDQIFLSILIFILISGLIVGTHLLIIQDKEWKSSEVYNLITRDIWEAHVPSSSLPKLQLPITKVLFLQTNSSSCDSKSQCSKLINDMQLKHMSQLKESDIVYNFIISKKGYIFEGRGWNFQTSWGQNNESLTVAFIGNFNEKPPTRKQVKAAKTLLELAISEGKLDNCYDLSIWEQNRFLIELAQNLLPDDCYHY